MRQQQRRVYQVITVLVIILFCILLLVGIRSDMVSAKPVCEPMTIEFLGEDCTDSICTWSYKVCQPGFALSHWVLGLCDWLEGHVTEAGFIDSGGIKTVLSRCIEQQTSPCWSFGLDPTTGLSGFKWDNLEGPEDGECWTFYFTIDVDLEQELIDWKSKNAQCISAGTITGPRCDVGLGSIIAFKYYDGNKNGEYDEGDYELQGWQICLQSLDSGSIICKITDENGLAAFEDLPTGSYKLCEILKDGWVNSDPGGTSTCKEITVEEGEFHRVQFGNWQPATTTTNGRDYTHEVGITIVPVNKVGLLVPWLVLLGLFIIVAGFGFMLKWWRAS